MKIPFSINFRPQVESGEYKVILDCGVEAEILAWDKPGEYPIVCMAKKESAIPFRTDNNGIAYHYPEGSNYSDLFLVTPKPELSEFENKLRVICEDAVRESQLFPERTSEDFAKKHSAELIDLARKELIEEQYTSDPRKTDLYKLGKAEALKDLPRWKKCTKNTLRSYGDEHFEYRDDVCYVVISGREILLSDLEKLPMED